MVKLALLRSCGLVLCLTSLAGTIPASAQTTAPNGPPRSGVPTTPVGEAPEPMEPTVAQTQALPEGARVLTPSGRSVAETSFQYDQFSSNRLIFRGVEIVPGIQLGLLDANAVRRDTVIGAMTLRHGIFDRAEIEVRVPYLYRHDRLTVVSQQVTTTAPPVQQTTELEGHALGDVEFGGRYQLNRASAGGPIFVSGLRVRTPTGRGPYDVDFDASGVAQNLATGSGFWGIHPNLTMLYPSDPVVIFANVGYLHNFSRNIDRTIGTTHVGVLDPGGAIDASLGFGFAVNQQFAFSLGISNTVILPTELQLGATRQRLPTLILTAFTLGWSYTFSPRFAITNNFEFGATADAPDLRAIVRLPYRF